MSRPTIRTILLLVAFSGLCAFPWLNAQIRTGIPEYSSVHQCQANLKQIEGAKAMWATDHQKTTNDLPTWADLVGRDRYLVSQPQCSKGGAYTLRRVGEKPRCTMAGHSL